MWTPSQVVDKGKTKKARALPSPFSFASVERMAGSIGGLARRNSPAGFARSSKQALLGFAISCDPSGKGWDFSIAERPRE